MHMTINVNFSDTLQPKAAARSIFNTAQFNLPSASTPRCCFCGSKCKQKDRRFFHLSSVEFEKSYSDEASCVKILSKNCDNY